MNVQVTRSERLFDGFLQLDRTHLRHETPGGEMSPEIMRLTVERGDGAGALLLDRDSNTLVLTRQFRYAHWKRGDGGSVLEIPAGVVPLGRDPEEIARNEVVEEAGYHVEQLRYMLRFYASPGTSTERVHLYFGEVTGAHRRSPGGGLSSEHEFIEVVPMPIRAAEEAVERGEIVDGKTIIALQWFRAHVGDGGRAARRAIRRAPADARRDSRRRIRGRTRGN
jgi:nudix-type nucleoside diphosphatase (YffH/AdpP family)